MSSAEADRIRKVLANLVKEKGNRCCAECNARQPSWASTNLGVFFCLRCSGIHRKLGVHISKVKSINLDSWTSEQCRFMENHGNQVQNACFEATMPANRKIQEESSPQQVEDYLRDKYEYKTWYKKVARPVPLENHNHGNNGASQQQKAQDHFENFEANFANLSIPSPRSMNSNVSAKSQPAPSFNVSPHSSLSQNSQKPAANAFDFDLTSAFGSVTPAQQGSSSNVSPTASDDIFAVFSVTPNPSPATSPPPPPVNSPSPPFSPTEPDIFANVRFPDPSRAPQPAQQQPLQPKPTTKSLVESLYQQEKDAKLLQQQQHQAQLSRMMGPQPGAYGYYGGMPPPRYGAPPMGQQPFPYMMQPQQGGNPYML